MATPNPTLINVDLTANHQPEILKAIAPFIALAAIAVLCRFWSRKLKKVPCAADDWTILAGLLLAIGCFIVPVILVRLGVGRHVVAVPSQNYVPILKTFYAFQILYPMAISVIKLSILLLYRRLFETPTFSLLNHLVGCLVIGWWISMLLVYIFTCHPISAYWDHTIESTCINAKSFYRGSTIANMAIDAIILALPLHMVWRLHTSTAQKIGLTFIFMLGGLIIVVSAIRFAAVARISEDFTWDYEASVIWTSIETSVGVICACLPTLRPVAQYILPSWFKGRRSSGRSDPNTPCNHRFGPISGPSKVREQFYGNKFALSEDDDVSQPRTASKAIQLRSKQSRDSRNVIIVENQVEVVCERV